MYNQQSYDMWSGSYDYVTNRTRDLEARAMRETVATIQFSHVLEMGCGTGKNTQWLSEHATAVTAVDFSNAMLAVARQKIPSAHVQFVQCDMNAEWTFAAQPYDLISFSLVLEHIQDLDAVFKKAAGALRSGGYLYLGELHPFKQYQGSKARFDHEGGQVILECYIHNISEYFKVATRYHLQCVLIEEWFDEENGPSDVPRLLTMLFTK